MLIFPGDPTPLHRAQRLVWRLVQAATNLGPYHIRAVDEDGCRVPIVSDAPWSHRPMPHDDAPLMRALEAHTGDSDPGQWWRDGWCSAFLSVQAIADWFETDWERAALEAHDFVARAYAVDPARGEVVLGDTQALVRPEILIPARCIESRPVAAVFRAARRRAVFRRMARA